MPGTVLEAGGTVVRKVGIVPAVMDMAGWGRTDASNLQLKRVRSAGQCGPGVRTHRRGHAPECGDEEDIPGGRTWWGARVENDSS